MFSTSFHFIYFLKIVVAGASQPNVVEGEDIPFGVKIRQEDQGGDALHLYLVLEDPALLPEGFNVH